MGQNQILKKLESHLVAHTAPTEESHVMYLLAEIRKYLDQEQMQESKYAVVRFYANWCVHKVVKESRAYVKKLVPDVIYYIQNSYSVSRQINKGDFLAQFLSLENLRVGLQVFLNDKQLPTAITQGANWEAFRANLFGILSEQSFIDPINGSFTLIYSDDGNGFLQIGALTGNLADEIYFIQKDLA